MSKTTTLSPVQKSLQHALSLCQQGQFTEAKIIYSKLIKSIPNNTQLLTNLGTIELQTGNVEQGIKLIQKSIQIEPLQPQAISNLGNALLELGRYEEAIQYYSRAINLNPNFAVGFYNRGKANGALKQYQEAVEDYSRAISIEPNYLLAYINAGAACHKLKEYEKAISLYDQAITLKPDYAEAYFNRAIVLNDLKQHDAALEYYDRAIRLKPDYAEAFYNRGAVLNDLKRYGDALAYYDQAIQLKPDYAEAFYNRAVVYHDLKRYANALDDNDRAIQLKPDYAEAFYNRAVVYHDLKRYADALANYDHAIQLKADYAEAFNNRGTILNVLCQFDQALVNYDQAIILKSDYAEAYLNRGQALNDLKRYDEALQSYQRCFLLNPHLDFALGALIGTKTRLCDWENYQPLISSVEEETTNYNKVCVPFTALTIFDNPQLQQRSAEAYVKEKYPVSHALPKIAPYPKHQKIRLGYFSADFHNHATMHLMAELFERHDHQQFELIAFSFGPNADDEWRKRAIASFDQFIDVRDQTDIEVALIARQLQIDIAIDLKGFTQHSRTGIFAHRSAPVQVNYLGYPGTMGADFIDYIVADTTLIPPESQGFYSEKIIYMPDSYQVNMLDREISKKIFTRQEVGLPEEGFVFCCFNSNYKISPNTFDSWMHILQQVESSVLWLFKTNDTAINNLRREAEIRGIDSQRLVFASFLPIAEHLKRIQLADLFLDTLPYNAHTTASDALRVGLPIVTLIGESFASRVAASLLNAISLPELITTSPQAYEALAIALANTPQKLSRIKASIKNNSVKSALYNSTLFTSHIEEAYKQIHKRHQAGLVPDHIII